MHTCIRAYVHTCIRAYVHTCIRAYVHTCIRAYVHTCIRAYVHTCIRAYVHTCIRAYVHTCIRAYVHTCIRAYVHTCIRAYVHTCIRAYVHMCIRACVHTYTCLFVHIRVYKFIITWFCVGAPLNTYLHIHTAHNKCLGQLTYCYYRYDHPTNKRYSSQMIAFAVFHAVCVDTWLLSIKYACPVCKRNISLSSNTAEGRGDIRRNTFNSLIFLIDRFEIHFFQCAFCCINTLFKYHVYRIYSTNTSSYFISRYTV